MIISKNTPFAIDSSFLEKCKKIYEFQSRHTAVYRNFLQALGAQNGSLLDPDTIPLLPIRAFKQSDVISEDLTEKIIFESSGTSAMTKSRHLVAVPELYQTAILKGFKEYFSFQDYSLICYMPGYEENERSSLIWMARYLINKDPDQLSSFLPSSSEQIEMSFKKIQDKGKKILLFGAAFGLLDLIEKKLIPEGYNPEIIETGGMKTFRREMSKESLRNYLSEGFGTSLSKIHSEYGMCELLSQMYAIGGEWFNTPEWVYVSIREHENPSKACKPGEEGKIGIIDLANMHSCSFILTEDRGIMDEKGRFKVLGRWNSNNLRGCNFLVDS